MTELTKIVEDAGLLIADVIMGDGFSRKDFSPAQEQTQRESLNVYLPAVWFILRYPF